jgi:hypothetical protein
MPHEINRLMPRCRSQEASQISVHHAFTDARPMTRFSYENSSLVSAF